MHGKAALYASTYILRLHSEVPPAPALQFNCNWLFPTVYWHFLLPSTYKLNCPKWPRPTGSTGQYFTHELGLNEKLHIKRSTLILQKLSNVNRHTGCPAREFHLVRCMQCMLCQKVGFCQTRKILCNFPSLALLSQQDLHHLNISASLARRPL